MKLCASTTRLCVSTTSVCASDVRTFVSDSGVRRALRRERLVIDRRARERRDIALWRRLRIERALAHRREVYGRWAWAVATPEGRAEFVLYSDRMARLHRIRDIGEDRRDNGLVVRVDRVIALENARHANVIAVIISKRPL